MTQSTPIERVIASLSSAGFRPLVDTLVVSNVPFSFAGVLVGSGYAQDLVVVVDTIEDPAPRIQQKIAALGRALDVAASKRPMTAVLVGPRPSASILESLSHVCRVLPVGTLLGSTAEGDLRDWLSVLRPLVLPSPTEVSVRPVLELSTRLPDSVDVDLRDHILGAAQNGAGAVRLAFRELMKQAMSRA